MCCTDKGALGGLPCQELKLKGELKLGWAGRLRMGDVGGVTWEVRSKGWPRQSGHRWEKGAPGRRSSLDCFLNC